MVPPPFKTNHVGRQRAGQKTCRSYGGSWLSRLSVPGFEGAFPESIAKGSSGGNAANSHEQTRTNKLARAHLQTRTGALRSAHLHEHAWSSKLALAHSHTHTHTHTCAPANAREQTCMNTLTRANSHDYTCTSAHLHEQLARDML